MANMLPPMVYDAPQVAPLTGGLYGAASVQPTGTPARLVGGVHLLPTNCGTEHGLLPVDCPPTEPIDIDGDGPDLSVVPFPATTVYAADECGLVGRSEEAARDRAVHQLSIHERADVEGHTATLLQARVTDVRTADGDTVEARLVQAVAIAEAELGAAGLPGVLHISAGQAAYAQKAGMVRWQGGQPLTPLGHRWAFGGGYGALGDTLYVTGPVTVLRSDVSTGVGMGHRQNKRLVVAQRDVSVAWECLGVGINFAETAGE